MSVLLAGHVEAERRTKGLVSAMGNYDTLPDVYEWLIPDQVLTPSGATEAFGDLVDALPRGTRVLDCACGTGQLAVGLASRGLDVTASDASPGMVRRTQELARESQVSIETAVATWDELPNHFAAASFDVVFCVGNSLGHAEGAAGRASALASMARMLSTGGHLVLNSRAWERVREAGSRIDVRDRLTRRDGRDAVVMYQWQIHESWEQEHHLQVVVAQVESDGSVISCSERLSLWPFRFEELIEQLHGAGFTGEETTFDQDGGGYKVIAVRDRVPLS
jgi:SAM-dependent methyltransferase